MTLKFPIDYKEVRKSNWKHPIPNFSCLLPGVTGAGQSWSSVEWTVDNIRKNYVVKTGEMPVEYRCKICSKISNQLDHATEHALTRHLTGQSKCPLCSKMGKRKTLQVHVGRDHNMSLNIYSMKISEKRKNQNV